MPVEHQCWWTRRRETELSERDGSVNGAGVPLMVLERAATLLATSLSAQPSGADEHGHDLVFANIASGAMHDECFFQLYPVTPDLKGALLDAVLVEHARYLGRDVNWLRVRPELVEEWSRNVVLRMRSFPARARLTVRCYAADSGFLGRMFAKTIDVDCSTAMADIAE